MADDKKKETKEAKKVAAQPQVAAAAANQEAAGPAILDKFANLIKQIEEMSVLELSQLVKVLEDKFGVSAAAPVMVAAGAAAGGTLPAEVEEKTSFGVELSEVGSNKIAVIKAVRVVTQLGLKDAKDLVEAAPKMVKEGVNKEEAEKMKKTLEEAGCKVTLK